MININILHSERFRRLSKEGFWVVLGQVIAVIGSLVGVRILTELLTPAAYGELALGMTVATLTHQTIIGPLSNGATRFYAPAQEQDDLGGYLCAVRRLVSSATAGIVFIIFLTVTGLLVAGQVVWVPMAVVALIFSIVSGYNSILSGIQNAARQRSIVAIHQGAESWLRFLFAAGLVLWLGNNSTVAMVGYAVAVLPVLVSQYVFFQKIVTNGGTGLDKEVTWREQIWKYSWPFSVWGVFTWAQQVSDRWALGLFATTQDVGLYAVLFMLGYSPILTVTGVMTQFLAPILYQRAGDGSDRRRNANVISLGFRLTGFVLGVTAVVFFMAHLFHNQIFRVLVAREYVAVSYLLPWMLLGGGVLAAGQTIALNLMSQMRTRDIMVAKIATALLGVLSNLAGAYWFGITGIVMAGVLISLLYFGWMTMLSIRTVCD